MNNSTKKTDMAMLAGDIRNKNFDEAALGYTSEEALLEADRCLGCKTMHCVKGCPVNVKIPDFISLIKRGDFEGAYNKVLETNSLPAICGRVCPQESQCEKNCVRAIKGEAVAIGRLERFVADYASENNIKVTYDIKNNNEKVAVIGSGPAGLTCAGDLAKMGYDVTIFEAFHKAGGVLVYGIPKFRLPKVIVESEIEKIKCLGVKIKTNMVIGKIFTVDELFELGFKAVFIGSGAGLPNFMNIEGENLNGIYSANEYLTRINLMKAYRKDYDTPITKGKNIAVIGGGNVAMDSARSAKRLGAENVYIVYRRGENELPARKEEIEHAKEEGIIFKTLTNPIKYIGKNGSVTQMVCNKMALGPMDGSGRRSVSKIRGELLTLEVDTVIVAIGTSPNPIITKSANDIMLNDRGCIRANINGVTSKKGVFAGGDAVTGAATVIMAMGAGKNAAAEIDVYIKSLNDK